MSPIKCFGKMQLELDSIAFLMLLVSIFVCLTTCKLGLCSLPDLKHAGGNEPRLIAAANAQLNKLPFYHSFWNRTTKVSLVSAI